MQRGPGATPADDTHNRPAQKDDAEHGSPAAKLHHTNQRLLRVGRVYHSDVAPSNRPGETGAAGVLCARAAQWAGPGLLGDQQPSIFSLMSVIFHSHQWVEPTLVGPGRPGQHVAAGCAGP